MTDAQLASDLMDARARAALLQLPSALDADFDLDAAYRVAAEIERRRCAAGEQTVGWKIGFTNRSIWPRYGVHQPIWGRVWRSTLTLLDGVDAEVSLGGLVQPRIEPEIVFGLATAPQPGMDLVELQRCLAWVAHGVELVHTHYANWKFGGAADTVADFGLHGRLLVGPRVPVDDWATLAADLTALTMRLCRGEEEIDRGHGALVLDGPLQALQHALQAMAAQPPGHVLVAGEVVTTGTLTDAWPIAPGQAWHTSPGDARLPGLNLHFIA